MDRSVELLAVEPRRLRTSLDRRKLLDPNVASSSSPGQKGLDLGEELRPPALPMTLLTR
jgi:hypothetical protein